MDDNKIICNRCGYIWVVSSQKRERKDLFCVSCRAKPAKKIVQYGNLKCMPHQGEFADDGVTPLSGGVEVLPGKRICNHSDCVNPEHIEKG
jgi:hypothetical protein